ncbi:MAG: outer membrane protein [Hyphomicrobiales bacterium]|nr:outer membrane protein [Hyphomicrobiales bacterium]
MALIRFALAAQLVVLSLPCLAADRPTFASRGIAPDAFYFGVQGGMAWAKDKMQQYSQILPLWKMEMSSDTAFGGLHVGYQRNFDQLVLGLEADYDWGGKQGKGVYSDGTTTFTRTYQMDSRSTLRAKLGYDFGVFSIYATGGGAMTNLKTTGLATTGLGESQRQENFGFGATLGAGLVYRLTRNWAAFSEYRYADFGQSSAQSDSGVATGAKASHRVTETSVRAGATYYFR